MRNVVVIGATGLVGRAIATALAHAGHTVLAVGRNQDALEALREATPGLRILRGDVGSDAAATQTAEGALAALGQLDAVVTSVNPPRSTMRLSRTPVAEVAGYFDHSLFAHLCAANAFVPRLAKGGKYIAVGGAASDFVWPEHGHISMNGAAQRMLFRVLAAEWRDTPVSIHEYIIAAMVQEGTGGPADAVSAKAVGEDLAARLAGSGFDGQPVLRFPVRVDK